MATKHVGPELRPLELQSPTIATPSAEKLASAAAVRVGEGSSTASTKHSRTPPSCNGIGESGPKEGTGRSGVSKILALGAVSVAAFAASTALLLSAAGKSSTTHGAAGLAVKHDPSRTFAVSAADKDAAATRAFIGSVGGANRDESDRAMHCANAAALREMQREPNELGREIEHNQRTFYRVYVLDFKAQDGDRVSLFVDGTCIATIDLTNGGEEILVPLHRKIPAMLELRAIADGGGGVTVGLLSSEGKATTETLNVGESEHWEVVVK